MVWTGKPPWRRAFSLLPCASSRQASLSVLFSRGHGETHGAGGVDEDGIFGWEDARICYNSIQSAVLALIGSSLQRQGGACTVTRRPVSGGPSGSSGLGGFGLSARDSRLETRNLATTRLHWRDQGAGVGIRDWGAGSNQASCPRDSGGGCGNGQAALGMSAGGHGSIRDGAGLWQEKVGMRKSG